MDNSRGYLIFSGHSLEAVHLAETDSTNTYARKLLADGFTGEAVIIADSQTLGRGRCGKSFFSERGGLYMSVIMKPKSDLEDFTLITSAVAVAVADAIREVSDCEPKIKWVNDIYVENRKVCGILCESVFSSSGRLDAVIVGIGVNLGRGDFPDDIADTAGRISISCDRNTLAEKICERLFAVCDRLPDRGFMEKYRAYSLVLGSDIRFTYNGEWLDGVALSVDSNGRLEIELPDGTRKLLSGGEISVRVR